MKKLLLNPYFTFFAGIYISGLVLMIFIVHYPVNELIFIMLIIGVLLPAIAYMISRSSIPVFTDKKGQEKEVPLIAFLIAYFAFCITYFHDIIDLSLGFLKSESNQAYEITSLLLKLILIVCIPILFYKLLYNFKLKDWGIYATLKSCLSKRSLFIFVVMASVLFILQLFMGNGAKPVREGLLTSRQFLIGIPLFYLWLVIEVGIVEEFFFRAFLQSRLTALLDSQTGGIVISALLFGLAHAPGIYLRGGGEPANLGTEPGLILSVGYSITVLSIAGIFLSVIWAKTRNFWLIVSIHAFVDLLPGLAGFVETWGIK